MNLRNALENITLTFSLQILHLYTITELNMTCSFGFRTIIIMQVTV